MPERRTNGLEQKGIDAIRVLMFWHFIASLYARPYKMRHGLTSLPVATHWLASAHPKTECGRMLHQKSGAVLITATPRSARKQMDSAKAGVVITNAVSWAASGFMTDYPGHDLLLLVAFVDVGDRKSS